VSVIRIQRQRTKGWRMPEGAVYVGRPTIFGNPWSMRDVQQTWPGTSPVRARLVAVRKYREELQHGGLLSDWGVYVSDQTYEAMHDRWEALAPGVESIIPLFRDLLKDATALACWCPLDQPCHADVLIELLA
jgi:hypothetical protein